MARLKDKVCIITGATSGIGKRTAEIFASEGAKLVIAGRREVEGLAVAKSIGASCDFVRTDVTIEAQMKALIEFTVSRHGRIDCMFNNAGGPAPVGSIDG
jgi:NAD(P)-dependent dehydrogenase (short-subunit alcohol dehydrogenase family)